MNIMLSIHSPFRRRRTPSCQCAGLQFPQFAFAA